MPRQAGLNPDLRARVVFTPKFGRQEAVAGLEEFSHIWLIWQFDQVGDSLSAYPPALGGENPRGVFATRSPLRPNPLGLSCVELLEITPDGTQLLVGGADMLDGTPILDIKPYVWSDSHPQARFSYTKPKQH